MENGIPRRMVIYAKDIETITGRKRTAARNMIRQIKIMFKKERNDFITVREFSHY